MVVLMFISAVGFLLSLVFHIASMLQVEMPLGKVMPVLTFGMCALYLPAGVIVSRLRRSFGKKAFREALKSASPVWMPTAAGLIIIYAIVNAIIQLVWIENAGLAVSGIYMAAYSTAIVMYYSYRRLKSSGKDYFPDAEN